VNAVGCMMAGAQHELTRIATAALLEHSGAPVATLFGSTVKVDVLTAALINGTAGAAYSFDDTYADAMLHPSGPIIAALLALAERSPMSGQTFTGAFAAGLEVACRLTKALTVPPANGEIGWSQTGIVCGLATALACGRVLGLNAIQMEWALSIAASEAAGTRASHGSMSASLIFGHASQTGLRASLLAAKGFSGATNPIEHRYGVAAMFAECANLEAAIYKLGEQYEILGLTYKPFPCGLVLHPAVDAALQLKQQTAFPSHHIQKVALVVSSAAANFGLNRDPIDDIAAKVSLFHWVAVSLHTGRAGISEGQTEWVRNPETRRIRHCMQVTVDPAYENDAASIEITLTDGNTHRLHLPHCIGSTANPMTDAQLDLKCRAQAELTIDAERAGQLAKMCWGLDTLADTSALTRLTRATEFS
jgi:2-methylcitrate dehydratase PrpD